MLTLVLFSCNQDESTALGGSAATEDTMPSRQVDAPSGTIEFRFRGKTYVLNSPDTTGFDLPFYYSRQFLGYYLQSRGRVSYFNVFASALRFTPQPGLLHVDAPRAYGGITVNWYADVHDEVLIDTFAYTTPFGDPNIGAEMQLYLQESADSTMVLDVYSQQYNHPTIFRILKLTPGRLLGTFKGYASIRGAHQLEPIEGSFNIHLADRSNHLVIP